MSFCVVWKTFQNKDRGLLPKNTIIPASYPCPIPLLILPSLP